MRVKLLLALVGLALVCALGARADPIEVRSAAINLREDQYVLDADFDIALTPILEEILAKGVPLNFLLEVELIRPRWYWFNDKVAQLAQPYKLSYNSLTRQYRVSLGTLYQNFGTLDEALRFIGSVRSLPVADKAALQQGVTYQGALRLRLDVSQLPKPFQITALGSREWNVGSEWQRFAVAP